MRFFTAHPHSVCMTYLAHFRLSMNIAALYFLGSVRALVHAFVPTLCISSSTETNTRVAEMLAEAGCR